MRWLTNTSHYVCDTNMKSCANGSTYHISADWNMVSSSRYETNACAWFRVNEVDTQVLGLPIEEALIFWRKSFSKITDDKFNKEYKYNIRHSFGLEGKRANYPAKT